MDCQTVVLMIGSIKKFCAWSQIGYQVMNRPVENLSFTTTHQLYFKKSDVLEESKSTNLSDN
jgi:hypothetical protein